MKLGIALSGCGMKGIAHAGVLRALEESNIKIDVIGGTSSGSMIAVLYAMGFSPYYIYVLFKRYAKQIVELDSGPIISGIGSFVMNKKIMMGGLKSSKSIEESFNDMALKKGVKAFKDLQMPIAVPAVDIVDGKKYVFSNKEGENYISDISIGKGVAASSSFPAVFEPCKFLNHKFLDGGILDNTPVDEVRKLGADKVIAVTFIEDETNYNDNIIDIVIKTVNIMGGKIIEKEIKSSDYILEIKTSKIGLLDIDKIDLCYKSRIYTNNGANRKN